MPTPVQSLTNIVGRVHQHVQASLAGKRENSIQEVKEQLGVETKYVDLTIQFIHASRLPNMEITGTTDPFFRASLDHKLTYISSVQHNTLNPIWDEVWQVKNVPTTARLSVEIMDKDHRLINMTDNYIGGFETSVSPETKEAEIHAPLHVHSRGIFRLKIDSSPSQDNPIEFPYLFDGPVHYSRHSSSSVGALTKLRDTRLYSTWKIYIKGIPQVFGNQVQLWNREYKAAQTIFKGPTSLAVRSSIQAGHRLLYARSVSNAFGVINSAEDVFTLLRGGTCRLPTDNGTPADVHRIKPAVYTYVISTDDNSVRFSETGAAFFVDFASKHALHSNCAEAVWYSGEFHPRPAGGWSQFSEATDDKEVQWELVIDNNSGTYSPDPTLLPKVKKIVEMNFPGFAVVALRHDDPELKASTDACRAYALNQRGVAVHELQPHATEGEETLMAQVQKMKLEDKNS